MNLALFSVIAKIRIRKTSFQTSNYINSTFFTVLFFIGYKPPSGDLLMEKGEIMRLQLCTWIQWCMKDFPFRHSTKFSYQKGGFEKWVKDFRCEVWADAKLWYRQHNFHTAKKFHHTLTHKVQQPFIISLVLQDLSHFFKEKMTTIISH